MCGMAAGFAAMFGTPISSAVFAMEVVNVGIMYYSALVPCLLSALIGAQIAEHVGLTPPAFVLTQVKDVSLLALLQVAALGILFALLSILFCRLMHQTSNLYERYFNNPMVRIAVGGALVVLLTMLEGSYDYNGLGAEVIAKAFAGEAYLFAFLLKMLFTALTLGAGYKGGEIIPVFFTGATFGCRAASFFGLHPSFGAGLGMISVFCGVTNCPMTSLLLAMELFGGVGILFLQCLAVTVSVKLL